MKMSELKILIENKIREQLSENIYDTTLRDSFYDSIGVNTHDMGYDKYASIVVEELKNLAEAVNEKQYYIDTNIKSVYQKYINNNKEDEFWDVIPRKLDYDSNLESFLDGSWGSDVLTKEEFNKLLEDIKIDAKLFAEERVSDIYDNLKYIDNQILKLKY